MAFLDYVLQPPAYGWQHENGDLVKPTPKQIFAEFFSRLNVFKDRKNWLAFFSWLKVICLVPFFFLFIFKFFSLWMLLAAFVYSMIIMGSHGTIWYHRYCTHGAYQFKNKFWRFVTHNLTLQIIPEEIYVVSHHVHHAKSDQPGDPYNANGGFLYCFLADVNHQPMNQDLSEADYAKAANLMKHTGVKTNSYTKYQKWGSMACPVASVLSWIVNWGIWYGIFYLLGGHALACTLFGAAGFWAIGVRTFNYDGHGQGKDKRKDGVDYNRNDMSINQLWPGFVAGEWHNNHHLYPKSARSGFMAHQIDFAWYYIKFLSMIGAVTSYRDSKKEFMAQYRQPYLDGKNGKPEATEKELVTANVL
ncbi:fatty acid desaturase [uncultured Mucilaginibacter sp.]|uniref:fatty acid desaturase n=1 Tax=uncultured Mucilaginibacter sp. TaxID=797541 RepID=UPI0025CCC3FB|nr:fatty acid desaturase [uncultured Mucilaginibacter sp.]